MLQMKLVDKSGPAPGLTDIFIYEEGRVRTPDGEEVDAVRCYVATGRGVVRAIGVLNKDIMVPFQTVRSDYADAMAGFIQLFLQVANGNNKTV